MRLTVLGAVLLLVAGAHGAPGDSLSFTDPQGDVERDGQTVMGGISSGVDIRRVVFEERSDDVHFELHLTDLDALAQDLGDDGYHVQYALTFTVDATGRDHSMRATYGNQEYVGRDGAWRFQIHDHFEDEWSATDGRIVGDSIQWDAHWSELGLVDGSTLSGWSVQAWSSSNDDGSRTDWASDGGVHALGDAPPEPTPSALVVVAGVVVVGAVLVGIALLERRR